MRVGKRPNVVEAKKTRSCVVRLEKVSNIPKVSPSPEDHRIVTRTTRLSSTAMVQTPKLRRGAVVGTLQQEVKPISGPIKKRVVGGSSSHGNLQTPQQQKATNTNVSNIRSNQKIKIISRPNKTTPATTPSRDETPPPTIAAGRSRRAIKPNPKYASEDLVTPKVVRNVATLGSSTSRGSSALGGKTRKASTSSDDFYNRNSDDDYDGNDQEDDDDDDDDLRNDKAYQANAKDENDSDFSVIEEQHVRSSRSRGRPKRAQESTQAITTPTNNKLPTQTTPSNIKRTTNSTAVANSLNLRSAPSQLQQIRRSFASANAQRNLNLLSGGGGGGKAQKRKLEEIQDSSDNESNYIIKRKQLLLSSSTGLNVKLPVRENRVNATSTPFAKSRLGLQKMCTPSPAHFQHHQTINGSNKINNSQMTSSRRAIEISAKSNTESITKPSLRQTTNAVMTNQHIQKIQNPLTTQAKILALKSNRLRSGSPKLPMQKEKQNNGSAISISSALAASSSSLNISSKTSDKTKALNSQSVLKSKNTPSPHNTITVAANCSVKTLDIKDNSPNSTMDDFETMPTFTIVNVNDIINKKGDVLITKSKSNNNSKTPTVIEFSESISLDDDDDDEDDGNGFNDDVKEVKAVVAPPPMKLQKLPTLSNRKEFENKKSPITRSSELLRKLPTKPPTSADASSSSSSFSKNQAPQILNHKLGLRNSRVTAKTTTTLTATLTSPDKPAPRILNSVVAKKTQPVKPMIANMDDSADESFPLSLDEDDDDDDEVEEETEDEIESRTSNLMQMSDKARKRVQQKHHQNLMEVDTEDTESQNTEEDDSVLQTTNSAVNFTATNAVALTPKQNTAPQRKTRMPGPLNTPIVMSGNKKAIAKATAAKENSLAATNQQVNDTTTGPAKQPIATTIPARKSNAEKVVISKQGDKIIKKITCFETWYVINMPMEPKRPTIMKNQLEMPLIRLANNAKIICLPNDMWSTKVTLYELSSQTLGKGTFATFTGDLYEHRIKEEDRGKYQPSCVMFRRSIEKNKASRMPYDRAVIFKNKTFYTNIEGKNVRLVGAPSIINTEREIEILLEVVNGLTLQSEFVEHISIVQ